jgi:hypothetical protein
MVGAYPKHLNPREGITTTLRIGIAGAAWRLNPKHLNPREGITTGTTAPSGLPPRSPYIQSTSIPARGLRRTPPGRDGMVPARTPSIQSTSIPARGLRHRMSICARVSLGASNPKHLNPREGITTQHEVYATQHAIYPTIDPKHLNPREGITTTVRCGRRWPATQRYPKHLNPREGITTVPDSRRHSPAHRHLHPKHLNPREGITTVGTIRRIVPTAVHSKHLNPREGITTH